MRAAASSSASGSPSSARHSRTTSARLAWLSLVPAAAARSTKSSTDSASGCRSSGRSSGGTRQTSSPAMRSGSRLVARMPRPRHAATSSAASSAHGRPGARSCRAAAGRACRAAGPPRCRAAGGRLPLDADGPADLLQDQLAPGEPGQLDQPHAARVGGHQAGGDPQRQAGLADAADPAQRDHARLAQQPAQVVDVALATHEPVGLGRKIVPGGSDIVVTLRRGRITLSHSVALFTG